MAHFIRLRGAWNVERDATPDHCGNIKLTRQFGCSTGLKAASPVQLAIEDVACPATVELNGGRLGQVINSRAVEGDHGIRCPARFDVTALLQPRNLLVIQLSPRDSIAAGKEADCLGLVQLEIE